MKLVINKCYGGFGLSAEAIKRMAEINGKECFFFKGGIGEDKYTEIPIEETKGFDFWSAFSVKNPDDHIIKGRDADGSYKSANESYNKISLDSRPDDRSDPVLIRVVEELGEKANGTCAKLKIVEIPDDVKWEIDEYDGIESIHEVHRSW